MKLYRLPDAPGALLFDIDSTLYDNETYKRVQVDCQIARFAATRGLSLPEAVRMIEEARVRYAAGARSGAEAQSGLSAQSGIKQNGIGQNEIEQTEIDARRKPDARRGFAAQSGARAFRAGRNSSGPKASLGNALSLLGVPIEESVAWRKKLLRPERFLQTDGTLQETLSRLSERFSFCVVTNNPVEVAARTLDALGVSAFFPEIFGLDTFMRSKPCRELFAAALESCGAEPERTISVGDRFDIDIALPLEMGMGGILVDNVRDVYRLPELLLKSG